MHPIANLACKPLDTKPVGNKTILDEDEDILSDLSEDKQDEGVLLP